MPRFASTCEDRHTEACLQVQCCFTSTEPMRTIMDNPLQQDSTSTFTQLMSPENPPTARTATVRYASPFEDRHSGICFPFRGQTYGDVLPLPRTDTQRLTSSCEDRHTENSFYEDRHTETCFLLRACFLLRVQTYGDLIPTTSLLPSTSFRPSTRTDIRRLYCFLLRACFLERAFFLLRVQTYGDLRPSTSFLPSTRTDIRRLAPPYEDRHPKTCFRLRGQTYGD